MLSSFRNFASGFGAKFLLGLLILSFSVWGIEDMLRSRGAHGALASVGGEEISRSQFERAYVTAKDRARQVLGKNYSPEAVANLHLERQVLEQLLMAEIVRQETRSLGLLPSDAEIARDIRTMPAFQSKEGTFDKALFTETLRRNGVSEKGLVEDMRREKATALLTDALDGAAPVNDAMVAAQLAAAREERSADILVFTPAQAKAEAPADDAIQAYYNSHKEAFAAPEYRSITTIAVPAETLLKSVAVPEEEIRQLYDERAAMFGKPGNEADYKKIRSDLEKEVKAEKLEEKAATLSSQLQDALAGGSTPAEAAAELGLSAKTLPPVTQEGALKSGEKLKDLPALDDFLATAFKLEEGADSALLRGKNDVFYLIHIDAVSPAQPKPLEEVRAEVKEAYLSNEAAKRLQALAEETRTAVDSAKNRAAELARRSLKPVSTGSIRRDAKASAGTEKLPQALTHELFTLPVGGVSRAYPSASGNWLIGIVTARKPAPAITADDMAKGKDAAQLRAKLEAATKQEVQEAYLLHLRRKYHVQVNEAALAAYAQTER